MNEGEDRIQDATFSRGLFALPRGLVYLVRHPGLWVFAGLPLAINLVLFLGLMALAQAYLLPALMEWLTPGEFPTWLAWLEAFLRPLLRWLVWGLAWLLLILVAAISFTTVGCVIAAPFNDLLSEKVERLLLGRTLGAPFSWSLLMEDAVRTIAQAAGKLAIVAGVFLVTLPFLLVPVVGQILVPAVNTLVAIWFLAVEFVDLPMARARWQLATRRAWCRGRKGMVLGFGSSVYVVCLIPLMGLLVLPAAVTAGTILFVETTDPAELAELVEGEDAGAGPDPDGDAGPAPDAEAAGAGSPDGDAAGADPDGTPA